MKNSLFYSGVMLAAVIFGVLLSFYIGSSNAALATSNLPVQVALTPAPAPTVIPTQPLPTITPMPTPTTSNDYCNPSTGFAGNFTDLSGTPCLMIQITSLIGGVMPILIIVTVVGAILPMFEIIMHIIEGCTRKRR